MNKKEQIFNTALKLFNQYGFDKTPTSQIAKEAGVATGTLFHFFSTKEDLINSLYLRCKESMISRTILHIDEEVEYRNKMRCLYLNFLGWGLNNTEEFLFFQQFSNSVYINERTKEEGKSKFESLIVLLKEGIDIKVLKDISIEYLVAITTSLIMSNLNYFIEHRKAIEDHEFVESTFEIVWNTMKN